MVSFTAEEVATIAALVVLFTEFVKFGGMVDEKRGLLVAAVLSIVGVGAYTYSAKPEITSLRAALWPVLVAFGTVLASAGGVYGFVRAARSSDVTKLTPGPTPPPKM